eukprot:11224454-Alexandrium_andersonii.AAC.1
MAGAPRAPAAARRLLCCWKQLVARTNVPEPVALRCRIGTCGCAVTRVLPEDALDLRVRSGGDAQRS